MLKHVNGIFCYALFLLSLACTPEEEIILVTEPVTEETALQDTIAKWEDYMESSAEGLWEDSVQYQLEIERIHTFGGEYEANPPFYDPLFVHVTGDTLIVTDEVTQSLVCMDTTGTVFWRFGEGGEGPGYFGGIGQVDVCGDTIGVINNGLSHIELLSRDGQLIGRVSAVQWPMDFSFINSNKLVAFSQRQPGGDIHIVDIHADSIISSFGDGEWETMPDNSSYANVWGLYIAPDSIIYMGMFESKLIFADIESASSSWRATREMPFELTECTTTFNDETGCLYHKVYSRHSSLCFGPFGELNMVFFNLMYNGEMANSPDNLFDRTPVTAIDRFDRAGNFLDTYCLPDSAINRIFYNGNGYLAAIQKDTGIIFGYRVTTRE